MLTVLKETNATISPWPLCLWDRYFDIKATLYTLSITMFTDPRRQIGVVTQEASKVRKASM